jgi:hypothetical protein
MKTRTKFPFPRKRHMPPDQITLTVTPALLNSIMTALAAQPYKDAAPVINALQQQIQAQLAPQRPVAVPSMPEVAQPVGKSG